MDDLFVHILLTLIITVASPGADGEAKFSSRVGTATIAGRVRGLFWGGPMMGVAFLLILIPWPGVPVGVQFAVSERQPAREEPFFLFFIKKKESTRRLVAEGVCMAT